MRTLSTAILVLSILPLGACHQNDLGTGANTVDRDYSKSATDASKAALQSVESAKLTVLSDKHDQMGGELVASRADGKEVRILVKSIDEKSCRVSVRVEPGDRELATMLHERIAGNLGMGNATTGWFGGNSLNAEYPADLAACTTSARRAIATLAPNTESEELHATWCHVDGRLQDSTPLRIRLEKVEDRKTRVTFMAGNSKSDDNKSVAQKLKDAFETTTSPAVGSR